MKALKCGKRTESAARVMPYYVCTEIDPDKTPNRAVFRCIIQRQPSLRNRFYQPGRIENSPKKAWPSLQNPLQAMIGLTRAGKEKFKALTSNSVYITALRTDEIRVDQDQKSLPSWWGAGRTQTNTSTR